MNSFMISKDIYSALSGSERLASYVGSRIFPIVAEEGTTYPFIVYRRDSVSGISCKCGIYEDILSFSVTCLAAEYLQGLEIADIVRDTLQRKLDGEKENNTYRNLRLAGASEEFSSEGWIQTLNFEVVVQHKAEQE